MQSFREFLAEQRIQESNRQKRLLLKQTVLTCRDTEIIKLAIALFVFKHDTDLRKWYVGITNDPYTRLVSGHNVNIYSDTFICFETPTRKTADNVEKYFCSRKMKGARGGGNPKNSRFVYVYKIGSHTRP